MTLAARQWGDEHLSPAASTERANHFLREVLTRGETRDDAGNTPRGGQTPDAGGEPPTGGQTPDDAHTPQPVPSPQTPEGALLRVSPKTPEGALPPTGGQPPAPPTTPPGTVLVSLSPSPEPQRRAPEPKKMPKRSRSNKIQMPPGHPRI